MQESERKAYNPKDFCKVYIMDQQPLNTAEQKDMQEFFTDLISKLEETSNTELKSLIKNLFGGTITNLVISLACPYVSCTLEEFYTVKCGWHEISVWLAEWNHSQRHSKATTCSESRKTSLLQTAAANTLFQHDAIYIQHDNYAQRKSEYAFFVSASSQHGKNFETVFARHRKSKWIAIQWRHESERVGVQFERRKWQRLFIGVTVHTGTAKGDHYYSFIRERNATVSADAETVVDVENDAENKSKWYLFNDAEVKPFDAATQLASECFGGETTSKTYDSTSDKFMDLSFEKTNSAYMLFYERINKKNAYKMAANQSEISMETN